MQLKEIVIEDTLVGDHYVSRETKGPYIRVSSSQENHIEDGLQFWWKSADPEEIKAKTTTAADQGTILHGYFLGILKGEVVDVQEEWAKKPCENFQKFVLDNQVKPQYLEKKLVSDRLGLGGTLDFIGTAKLLGDLVRPIILDWKTGGVYLSYSIQLSLYMVLHHENFGDLIQDLAVIQVHRDGSDVELVEINKPFSALRAGLCTFERWKFDNAKKLDWVRAPQDVLDARAKTRMAKRIAFEEANWKTEYQWPWLNQNSLEWFDVFYQKIAATNKIKE